MVSDDIRTLPRSPLLLAEGSVITPASVPHDATAIWLRPTPERQERQLQARDGRSNALYRLLASSIEAEVRAAGARTVAVEGITETVAAVEAAFRGALVVGPLAESLVERQQLLREANLAQAEQVRAFYARSWATGDPERVERAFICECGDRECVADVRRTVGLAASAPVISPGHAPARI